MIKTGSLGMLFKVVLTRGGFNHKKAHSNKSEWAFYYRISAILNLKQIHCFLLKLHLVKF